MQANKAENFARRGIVIGAVLLLHVGVFGMLAFSGKPPRVLPAIRPTTLILPPPRPPSLRPPPLPAPRFAVPPPLAVPVPQIDIAAAPLPQPATPRAIARVAPQAAHFGASGDAGLTLGLAASAGGGEASRRSLAAFAAMVRRRIVADKHQPSLAWDRRQSCVVNYRVTITSTGALAGYQIDPCAVPEINQAARAAISEAAPYPPPPDLGATTTEVQGSLIFRP